MKYSSLNPVKTLEKNLMENDAEKEKPISDNKINPSSLIIKEKTAKSKILSINISEYIPGIAFAAIIALTIILGAYFFFGTGITSAMLTSINFIPLLKAFVSLNFILFIICASSAIAFILLLGKNAVFKYAIIFSATGYILGVAISLALFPIFDFVVPLVAGAVAIPLGIQYLAKREEEVKYLKEIRSGASGTGRIITIICVVFTIFLLANSYAQKDKLQAGFVDEILGMTVGDNVKLGDTFTSQLADAIATQQGQTVDSILNTQELSNLNAKNDPDGSSLTQKLEMMKQTVDGNDYRTQIITNLKNQNMDVGKELLIKFPMINTLSEYAWIMGPLTALAIMLFIGGLIVKSLAALIYGAITKFI